MTSNNLELMLGFAINVEEILNVWLVNALCFIIKQIFKECKFLKNLERNQGQNSHCAQKQSLVSDLWLCNVPQFCLKSLREDEFSEKCHKMQKVHRPKLKQTS